MTDLPKFTEFVDWAIDTGLELGGDEYAERHYRENLSWRNWAKSARVPNPAQIDSGEDFVYDSDTVFQRHNAERLTNGVIQEAALAEYKQALRLQTQQRLTAKEVARATPTGLLTTN